MAVKVFIWAIDELAGKLSLLRHRYTDFLGNWQPLILRKQLDTILAQLSASAALGLLRYKRPATMLKRFFEKQKLWFEARVSTVQLPPQYRSTV